MNTHATNQIRIISAKSLLVFLLMLTAMPLSTSFAQSDATVTKVALEKLLLPWKDKIEASRREVVQISLSKGKDEPLASKIGGRPFLPKGQTLPKNSSGQEMYLLAQINFAEVPSLPDFPRSGLLQFFISSNEHYGANFEGELTESKLSEQKDFRILFHENLGGEAASFSYPPKSKDPVMLPFAPEACYRMTFAKGSERVLEGDFQFTEIMGLSFEDLAKTLAKSSGLDEDALSESLEEYFSEQEFQHQLGGYASFTQEDPRRAGSKKRLLFQISSEMQKGLNLMWGDLGVAGFFIDAADLKKKDFSKVMYNWDCG